MAKEAKDKEASESSGLADIMEVAEKIGGPADSFAGAGITIARDDDDDDDDFGSLAGGFGGGGSAALVAGGDEDDADLPAVAAFEPVALPSADPEPLPKPKSSSSAPQKKVALVEPPPAPKADAKPAKAKTSSGEAEPVVVAPSRSVPPPTPAAATAVNESGGGGKTWLVLLGLAAAGVAVWFFVFDKPAAPPDKTAAAATAPADPAPPEPLPQAEPPPVEPEPVAEDDAAMVIEDASTGAQDAATGGSGDAAAAEAGEEAEPVDDKAAWKTTRKLPRAKKEATDAPKDDPPTEPPPEPEPVPEPVPEKPMTQAEIDKKFSTECLLDPNKPGCEEFRKRQEAKLKDLDAHLADKLSQNDIRGAIGSVKSKAKACGSQHGATAGETVRVKLSIEGATGKVLSSTAISPHDSTPLGKCVAEALSGANFPRFKSQQQGTTYPVTM
jgi:hypothetical protein